MPQLDIKLLEENTRFWENRYRNNNIQWHIDDVNPMLFKHLKTLIPSVTGEVGEGSKADSNPKKIFIPLCGKTKDIPFLLSLGHEVFGVESFSAAIEELNYDHNLELKFDQQKSLYESEDGRLKIYCGDFFTCPIEDFEPFDCIWDRGSFIAVDYHFREAYVEMMKRAVALGTGIHNYINNHNSYIFYQYFIKICTILIYVGHKFRYLLQTVRYDKTVYPGPPR